MNDSIGRPWQLQDPRTRPPTSEHSAHLGRVHSLVSLSFSRSQSVQGKQWTCINIPILCSSSVHLCRLSIIACPDFAGVLAHESQDGLAGWSDQQESFLAVSWQG